ncbi:MAG: enoyl-CoA hydratase [Deltaproteobacteria bacterium HGW-Deltaproteobacteria-6]|jgi:enoyl-CoA hydratase/carnithine racemase|nr:MAG: enoyl-CoA hydratase [Deltaproteobacteria bacterium HGW-Deltaproteobacteria-6]
MDIKTSKNSGILTIEFNRPDKKNSITSDMYQMMADAIADGEKDPAVRVILFCGQPEMFSAGNDLEDFMNAKEHVGERPVAQFLRNLSGAAKPVIAAVSGMAIGIGVTMLLHCDQIYAAEHTKFSMPFAKLGLCPEFGSSKLLPEMIGHTRAAELLFFGESFSAEQAFDMGLVNKVLPSADLMSYAYAQAAKLVILPASSLRTTKRLMKARHADAVIAQMIEENNDFSAMLQSPEAKEAFAAFFERRKPDFSKFS